MGLYDRVRRSDLGPHGDRGFPSEGGVYDLGAPADRGPALDHLVAPGDTSGPQPEQADPCGGVPCPLSCNEAAGRCYRVQPTTFSATAIHDAVSATLGSTGGPLITVDTDDGSIASSGGAIRPPNVLGVANGIHWDVVQQSPGYPELAVFGVAALTIPAGTTLRVIGHRAFALYAAGDVTIAGTLTAAAEGRSAGPGGYEGAPKNGANAPSCFNGGGRGGRETGSGSSQIETGGGGGGRKSDGGRGGTASIPSPDLTGGGGGTANGGPSLAPLYGGCGGGAGGGPDTGGIAGDGGYGGGGGGAVHLAASGTITVTGTITAPGAGGGGGHYGAGGGGGGSGGAIFLEAPDVSVNGILAANGGGGGAASPYTTTANVDPGEDGLPSTQHAAGGTSDSPLHGGAGGSGGALAQEAGAAGADVDANTGGGGGAAGRIRINAQTPAQIQIGPQHASPVPRITASLASW